MRIGTIDRVQVDGARVEVFVRVDGDIEGPCPVAAFHGTAPDIVAGEPCALFSLEGPHGEFVVVPMEWLRAGAVADRVARYADVANLRADLIGHGHISASPGSPTGPAVEISPPNNPINPTITGADRFKVTHG